MRDQEGPGRKVSSIAGALQRLRLLLIVHKCFQIQQAPSISGDSCPNGERARYNNIPLSTVSPLFIHEVILLLGNDVFSVSRNTVVTRKGIQRTHT